MVFVAGFVDEGPDFEAVCLGRGFEFRDATAISVRIIAYQLAVHVIDYVQAAATHRIRLRRRTWSWRLSSSAVRFGRRYNRVCRRSKPIDASSLARIFTVNFRGPVDSSLSWVARNPAITPLSFQCG